MTALKVGLLSPGDMGHSVGRMLVNHGVAVFTCLAERSQRTKSLAAEAGIEDLPTYRHLVEETDMILSILVPAEAENAALKVSEAIQAAGKPTLYVDCNAIAPATVVRVGEIITGTGSRFVDAGIIGTPPRRQGTTRIYASGKDAAEFQKLSDHGLDIRIIGSEIGQASGLKMTYAALTKGTTALATELLVAAWRAGLYDALVKEFQGSQAENYAQMERSLPGMPVKAHRWVGEMEEIAKTFDNLDLTPKIYQGIADLYRFVSKNRLAEETPETLDKTRTLAQLIEALAMT